MGRLSTPGLVFLGAAGFMTDLFGTPYFLNHVHGPIRALGLAFGSLTLAPWILVGYRAYRRMTTKMALRDIDRW